MDKLIYKDYAAWKLENVSILEQFQQNNSIIYDRLEPVYVVLEHIYDQVCENQDIDEDLETIFEVGFNYLHTQFEVIKIYFETLFQSNCDDFNDYTDLLVYLIYILDIRNDLESQGLNSDIEELNDLENQIENMIMERNKDMVYIADRMNDVLKNVFTELQYDFVSVVDIFVEIAETLGIYIYEEKDIVIGREV